MADATPSRALIMMDFQNVALGMLGNDPELIAGAARLLGWARERGMPVLHVMLGFSAGYPELSQRNTGLAALAKAGLMLVDDPRTAIHAGLAPREGEPVIVKHRIDAFVGTGLKDRLDALAVDELVMAGVATSGVVLSSVRHALDLDFAVTLVEDCCRDFDAETHRTIMHGILSRQAKVVALDALVEGQ
ncbi:MAG: isochorismatase family cysteine hydrolase [Blastomonas sp.]